MLAALLATIPDLPIAQLTLAELQRPGVCALSLVVGILVSGAITVAKELRIEAQESLAFLPPITSGPAPK